MDNWIINSPDNPVVEFVPCPTCEAPAGQLCVISRGGRPRVHRERRDNTSSAVIGRDRCQNCRFVVVMPGQGKTERSSAQPPAYICQRFPPRPHNGGHRLTPVYPWGWCGEFVPMFE